MDNDLKIDNDLNSIIDWLKREWYQKQVWLQHGHYDTHTAAYVMWKMDFIKEEQRKLEALVAELRAKLEWSKDDLSYETETLKLLIKEIVGVKHHDWRPYGRTGQNYRLCEDCGKLVSLSTNEETNRKQLETECRPPRGVLG